MTWSDLILGFVLPALAILLGGVLETVASRVWP